MFCNVTKYNPVSTVTMEPQAAIRRIFVKASMYILY